MTTVKRDPAHDAKSHNLMCVKHGCLSLL